MPPVTGFSDSLTAEDDEAVTGGAARTPALAGRAWTRAGDERRRCPQARGRSRRRRRGRGTAESQRDEGVPLPAAVLPVELSRLRRKRGRSQSHSHPRQNKRLKLPSGGNFLPPHSLTSPASDTLIFLPSRWPPVRLGCEYVMTLGPCAALLSVPDQIEFC
jgi:hypothetical protein